ncbi:hypothetical protein ABI59_02635 [Acidobacteria bacterium Mor1]|nr:hypothetical protein ABI59_02635 [Acidobacteria bacterium Mor1]
MIILNETAFTLAPLAGQVNYPGRSMTVIVKGTFRLLDGRVAEPLEEQEYTSGDQPYPGDEEQEGPSRYESDLCPFKPRTDLLLVGSCYPPRAPVAECKVGFHVGRHGGELRVIGDRRFEKGLLRVSVTDPLPFERMELRAEKAFGGPGFPANPHGKGVEVLEQDGRKVQPLPNIESPKDPVTSPKSRPQPAMFAPFGRMWERRMQQAGTYDERWQKERWPWFPKDFDWAHFNSAAPEMQVDGYLHGDEPVRLTNLHPDFPEFESSLPGIRVRAFSNRLVDREARFAELEMNLDTVWVDADEHTLVLVWRGVQEVESEELDDVEHLYVVAEELANDPADTADWRHRFDRRLASLAAPEEDDVVDDLGEAPQEGEVSAAEDDAEDSDAGFDAESANIDAELAAAGVDAEEAVRRLSAQAPVDEEDEDAPAPEPLAEPWTRERVAASREAGEDLSDAPLGGLDLSALDLQGLDLSGADLSGANLRGANLSEAILSEVRLDGADLSGAKLSGANLAGATADSLKLCEAELLEADLAGVVLRNLDASRASLAGANFEDAELPAAVFDGCDGSGAVFSGCRLQDASFRGGNLTAAIFAGASLERVRFSDVRMETAVLEGALATGADFSNADLKGLRASEQGRFNEAVFAGARGDDSIWAESDLSGSDLAGVDFPGADFTGAVLAGADLHAADLREARLLKADLRGAVLREVDLFRGNLERADASEADLRGSNLYEVNLLGTVLDDARLDGADLGKTLLAGEDS